MDKLQTRRALFRAALALPAVAVAIKAPAIAAPQEDAGLYRALAEYQAADAADDAAYSALDQAEGAVASVKRPAILSLGGGDTFTEEWLASARLTYEPAPDWLAPRLQALRAFDALREPLLQAQSDAERASHEAEERYKRARQALAAVQPKTLQGLRDKMAVILGEGFPQPVERLTADVDALIARGIA
jgi:hypothetical protein